MDTRHFRAVFESAGTENDVGLLLERDVYGIAVDCS